ncbi:hypothetical protein D9M71_701690 [compost metagenome]
MQYGDTALLGIAAQADLGLADAHPGHAEIDVQRLCAADTQGDFALDQRQALVGKVKVDGRCGVQLQQAAIGQAHTAALAHCGTQVGAQSLQRRLLAEQPAGGQ